jgi:hypothetical protein
MPIMCVRPTCFKIRIKLEGAFHELYGLGAIVRQHYENIGLSAESLKHVGLEFECSIEAIHSLLRVSQLNEERSKVLPSPSIIWLQFKTATIVKLCFLSLLKSAENIG